MGYLAVWKVYEEMIADFRKRGKNVPENVMTDLKSARALIKTSGTTTDQQDNAQTIEICLANIESHLVSEGQRLFGTQYIDDWLKHLDEARKKIGEADKEEERFVPGIPRGQKWIRVKPSAEMPLARLQTLADESKLSYKTQKDGNLLVYGRGNEIKGFVKKMTTNYGSKRRK